MKGGTWRSENRGKQGSTIGGGREEFVEEFSDTVRKLHLEESPNT